MNVRLEVGQDAWTGTMSTNGSNPPYFHTRFTGQSGERSNTTKLLLSLGVAENALIEFEMVARDHLRYLRVIDPGKWRDGNQPSSR